MELWHRLKTQTIVEMHYQFAAITRHRQTFAAGPSRRKRQKPDVVAGLGSVLL